MIKMNYSINLINLSLVFSLIRRNIVNLHVFKYNSCNKLGYLEVFYYSKLHDLIWSKGYSWGPLKTIDPKRFGCQKPKFDLFSKYVLQLQGLNIKLKKFVQDISLKAPSEYGFDGWGTLCESCVILFHYHWKHVNQLLCQVI